MITETAAIPYDVAIEEARAAFAAWVATRVGHERIVVFCHFDADGLAAGAVFGLALARLGFTDVHVVPSGRGESAFSDEARTRLAKLKPAALIVTDLGVHAAGVLPGVPTLYVDHHRPAGTPEGDVVIVSGYTWEPIPCSAWLAYELCARLVDVADLDWVAAVGVISDLGEKAPWAPLPDVRKRYTAKWLKEAVALTNAARRAPAFDVERPLQLLMTMPDPRTFAEDVNAAPLYDYRATVNAAVQEARKGAPVFSTTGPWALVRMHSECQIHPLLAQQWRGRLPRYAVIAANTGYVDGVAFSARTSRKDLKLPALFQAIDLGPELNGTFGYGHDQASGGHLPVEAFDRLLDALGFPPTAHVADG